MTEQAAYINAVSDRLMVSLFKEKVVYQVYNKDNALKCKFVLDHKSSYPVSLQNAIFSSSTLVSSGMPFSLGPLNDSEIKLHYSLNYGLSDNLEIQESELFAIAYNSPYAFTAISQQVVGLQRTSDIHLGYTYTAQKSHKNAVYFYCQANEITVFAWKEGQFMLANRYPSENADETFYYVMLVIEQLELNPNELYFECISTKGMHETYITFFKNYVSPLHLANVSFPSGQTTLDENKEEELLAYFFAQCAL